MTDAPTDFRHIVLSGAYNIRDLGGYRRKDGGTTRHERVFRADSPHRLEPEDIDTLLGSGLRTVIDLRAPHETKSAPSALGELDAIDYLHLPLYDALAPGHMHQGTSAAEDPLPAFYARTLDTRGPQIAEVMQAIAEADPGVVLFHCTAGKDRTGLISALLLGNAGVEDEDIVADYARTEHLISDLVAEFLDLARENGTDLDAYRRVLRARPETMRKVLADLSKRYGTAEEYLAGIGMTAEARSRSKGRLTDDR